MRPNFNEPKHLVTVMEAMESADLVSSGWGPDDPRWRALSTFAAYCQQFGACKGAEAVRSQPSECSYDFSHTKHWCGYEECRDS